MKQNIIKAAIVLGVAIAFLCIYLAPKAISQDQTNHTSPTTTTPDIHDQRKENEVNLLTTPTSKVTSTDPSRAAESTTNAVAPATSTTTNTNTTEAPAVPATTPPVATSESAKDTSDAELDPHLKAVLESSENDWHPVPLSLPHAIMAGLKTNFDVLIKLEDQKAAEASVQEARGIFDPVVNISGNYEHESLPQNTEDFVETGGTPQDILNNMPRVFQERNYHYKFAIDEKTPIGTQLELKTQMDDLQNTLNQTSPLSLFSPEYQSFTGLSVTQPFLRNFGTDINEAGIRVAVLDKFVTKYEVQDQINTTISQIEQNYNQLSYLNAEFTAKEQDKELGVKIVNQRIKALERGESSPREVNRAESALAEIIEDETKIKNEILNHQAQLQALICSQPPERTDIRYTPEAPLTEHADADLNYDNLMRKALLNRPKYLEAKAKAEQQNLRLVYAKNMLWPELDFTSTLGENGLGNSISSSYHREIIQEGPQWSVGFTFSMPLGNNEAEGKYAQAQDHKKAALFSLSQIELNTSIEIRKLIQIIRTNRGRLQAMHLFAETASQTYETEKTRLEKGLTTDLDVLRCRRDLSEAKAREYAVLSDLNTSYVQLKEITGELLIDNKIIISQ